MKNKPIEKIFHSKDLNIAYAKGKAEERERVLEMINKKIDFYILNSNYNPSNCVTNSLEEIKQQIQEEKK